MPFLIFLTRAFIDTFGITKPTPENEKRAAYFIGALLFVIVCAVIALFAAFSSIHHA